jgi:hypothetical protein
MLANMANAEVHKIRKKMLKSKFVKVIIITDAWLSTTIKSGASKSELKKNVKIGLPPGTMVSLVAHKREIAGSIPTGSTKELEKK